MDRLQGATDSFTRFAINLLKNNSPITPIKPIFHPKIRIIPYFDGDEESSEIILREPFRDLNNNKIQQVPFSIQKKQLKKKKLVTKELVIKPQKLFCKCQKSKCLKQYCECYSQGQGCGPDCQCVGCSNGNDAERPQTQKQMQGCNCKKTGCAKRYCECYLRGQKCTFICNCVDCCNQDDESEEEDDNIKLGRLGNNMLDNSRIYERVNEGQ